MLFYLCQFPTWKPTEGGDALREYIHSLIGYLLSIYYVLGILLGIKDTLMNKADKYFALVKPRGR